MKARRSLLTAFAGALLLGASALPRAADAQDAGHVRLAVVSATAERHDKVVIIVCRVGLDNQTGKELVVYSGYYSAFDGLEVIASNAHGRRLARQTSTAHRSPYSLKPRPFPLIRGRNEQEVRFFLDGIAAGVRQVRLQLKGTLPGSGYEQSLSSNVLTVDVK